MRRKFIFMRPNKWMLMIGRSTQEVGTIYIYLDTGGEYAWGKATRSNVLSIDRCSTTRYIVISRHRPHETHDAHAYIRPVHYSDSAWRLYYFFYPYSARSQLLPNSVLHHPFNRIIRIMNIKYAYRLSHGRRVTFSVDLGILIRQAISLLKSGHWGEIWISCETIIREGGHLSFWEKDCTRWEWKFWIMT